jgi:hypothetical protein
MIRYDMPVGHLALFRWYFRFWVFDRLVPDLGPIDRFDGYLAEHQSKYKLTSAYAAIIAAINGGMPMMLRTRLIL